MFPLVNGGFMPPPQAVSASASAVATNTADDVVDLYRVVEPTELAGVKRLVHTRWGR